MTSHKAQPTETPESVHTTPLPLPAPLSPHWAFVVQLRQGSPLTVDGMQGRIEHIVSGQATCFASLDEVRAFMEVVLAGQREKPP